MTDSTNTIRFRFWLWLICFIGLIAPRRLAPGVASFNRNKLRETNPVAQTPQGVGGNCMREQYATCVKASVMLVAVLGLATVNRMDETSAAAAQANNSQNPALQEEKPFDQKQALADLRKKIAGQENKPAEEVFKNIQIPLFKKLPANLLPSAMEFVFSKALGVDCRHCHVVEQWEKDDKPTKQIARDMYGLMLSIQGDLRKMSSLKSGRPVTCYTCHRGQTKPEFELPELKKKQ